MNKLNTFLIYIGWYISMAVGGSILCGLFAFIRFNLLNLGYDKNSSDPIVVIMELTAAMMSGVLIFGRIYCQYFPCDDIAEMKKFMNLQIQLLHIITVIAVLADVIVHI